MLLCANPGSAIGCTVALTLMLLAQNKYWEVGDEHDRYFSKMYSYF